MRNGRGGACVPARTSAQRRFHPQRARPPPVKEAFPYAKSTSLSTKEAFPSAKSISPRRKGGIFIRRNVCRLRMMHTRCRWMRPCRATRAGTQAPPLPTSIKPLCHATFFVFARRRAPRRHTFLVLVHRRAPRRQPQSGMTTVSLPRPNKFVQTRAFC